MTQDTVQEPSPLAELGQDVIVDGIYARDDSGAIADALLEAASTGALVDELGEPDRIDRNEVIGFVAAHADHSDCGDAWDEAIETADTAEVVAELRWRAERGDAYARAALPIERGAPVRPSGLPAPKLEAHTLSISAGDLLYALGAAAEAIERSNAITVLGYVRVVAGAGTVCFTATDLDNEIVVTLDLATCEGKSFAACVEPFALLALARQLGAGDELRLALHENRVAVTWAGGQARLPYRCVEDFPTFVCKAPALSAPGGDLPKAFARLRQFISTEGTRYYLNGICLCDDMGAPVAVATDGCRMAITPIGIGAEIAAKRLIVWRKTVYLVQRLFSDDVTFSAHDTPPCVSFVAPGLALYAKTIDGAFPEWGRVARPPKAPRTARIDRAALIAALEAIAPGDKGESRRLSAVAGRLMVQNAERDDGTGPLISVDAGGVEGDLFSQGDVEVGFNGGYLRTVLETIAGAQVTVRAGDLQGPFVLCGEDDAEGELRIVMPLRI